MRYCLRLFALLQTHPIPLDTDWDADVSRLIDKRARGAEIAKRQDLYYTLTDHETGAQL